MSLAKNIAVFVYFFVTPYIQSPRWCTAYNKDRPVVDYKGDWGQVDCETAAEALGVSYSGIISFAPGFTGFMDVLCIAILLYHRKYKADISKKTSFKS